MGSFLGYIRYLQSNVTAEEYEWYKNPPIEFSSSEPTTYFAELHQVNGLVNIVGSQQYVEVGDNITDVNALIEIEYLKSLISGKKNLANCPANRLCQPSNFSTQFPYVGSSVNKAILNRSSKSYYVLHTDGSSQTWYYTVHWNTSYLTLLVKIGSNIYLAIYESQNNPNYIFTFSLLEGWGDSSIYQSTTGDYLQLEPFSSPRNVRPYEIQYKVKYSGEYIDNSEVTWELYLHQDSDTPVENTENVSLTNGVLKVGMFGPTSVFVKAIYNEYYAWASSSSVFIPYNPGGTSGSTGSTGGLGQYGGGTFGRPENSDNVGADLPVGSAEAQDASTNMYTRYLCNGDFLNILGEWLWSPDLGLTIAKATIGLLFSDPAESIISLMSYPFAITLLNGITTKSQDFYWGLQNAGFQGNALTSSAGQWDWGSIKIDPYWGNFLDYAPHTKVELYLPWGTGFVDLDPNQVMGKTITIKSNIEIYKGSCVHNVIDDSGCIIGSFSCQVAKQLPMTSNDHASKVTGMITNAIGMISGGGLRMSASKSGMGDVFDEAFNSEVTKLTPKSIQASHAMKSMGSNLASSALEISPPHVHRNGGFAEGSSGLGVQYPYIIVSRPMQSVPEEYGHHYGYPSNIYSGLRYLKGYTEIGEIHLEGIPATDSEIGELDRILKGGVIF